MQAATLIKRGNKNVNVDIANGATLSSIIDISEASTGGFIIPAALTGTTVTFQGAATEDGTFTAIYNASNAQVSITVAVSRAYPFPAEVMCHNFIKMVVSAQAAARVIPVCLKG